VVEEKAEVKEGKKKEEGGGEKPKVLKESIHVVSFKGLSDSPRTARRERVIRMLREYVKKHTREPKVKISEALNKELLRLPRKIEVKVSVEEKTADGEERYAFAKLPGEKEES
jgi:ribosomal protein L31E